MTVPLQSEEEVFLLRARNQVYLFLSKVFLGEFAEVHDAVGGLPLVFRGGELQHEGLLHSLRVRSVADLQLEYDNLFVAPGPYFVPPFESFHRKEKGDESLGRLHHCYRAVGFSFPADRMEREDHIGCELTFMHFLITAELQSRERGDSEIADGIHGWQRMFLKEHLTQWTKSLEQQVTRVLRKGYLLEAITYLRRFTDQDRDQLV